MVNYFVKYTVDKYVDDPANDVVATCKEDIELALQDRLKEGDDAGNFALLKEYRYNHPNIWRSADEVAKIDIVLERTAFGPTASPSGRAKLHRTYGAALFEQRRLAWGASEGTIRSGTEPGKDSAAVIAQAEKIVADASADANSPFNPRKRYLTEETRANDIAKFVNHYGTAAARAQCQKFGVDIAGRPLRKRA